MDRDSEIEEMLRKISFRNKIAAVAISSVFMIFGLLILILIELITIPAALKTYIAIFLLVLGWAMTGIGIYLLISIPELDKKFK
ncbi:MAG: hypothetical protein NZ879_07195 [Archaeoglobaceae archaeon]|nr:hypothetical protein [Archaeoglobaceae archaeon]MDW8118751.1 hypothetical protein [Archaeoglobaceae archaeon]